MFKLRKVYYSEIKKEIERLNIPLARAIDLVEPGDDCYFYIAEYPYGAKMLNNGVWQIPCEDGGLCSLLDPKVPKNLVDDLNYNMYTNPVYMVMDKVSEFYADVNGTTIPVLQLFPGDLIGLSAILRNKISIQEPKVAKTIWELSAGSRNCFMVPKVSDKAKHRNLQKMFDINVSVPESLQDHWSVFKEIAGSADHNWTHRILMFSKGWFKKIHDVKFSPLKSVFYDAINETLSVWGNRVSWDMAFAQIHYAQNIHFSDLATDITKSIFAIASNRQLGFSVVHDELLMPYKMLRKAYLEGYEIEDYKPIFMASTYLKQSRNNTSYFPFQYPISPNAYLFKNMHNALKVLDDVRYCFEKHRVALHSQNTIVDAADLVDILNSIDVQCIHTTPGKYHRIKSARDIAEYPEFVENKGFTHKTFPYAGKLFKGCIRVSKTD